MTTFEKIQDVVAEELGVSKSEVQLKTRFRALATDSLELASLIVALEDALGIEIPDDVAQRLTNIAEVMDFMAGVSAE